MILPDGTNKEGDRPRTGRTTLFVVAAVAIVIGFMVMGALSPAEPIAAEGTTTTTTSTTIPELEPPFDLDTFTVAQIVRGEPLDWRLTLTVDDGFPTALLDHEGWIYLFSTEVPYFSGLDQSGLRGWRTADGQSWESLGQVIPEPHRIRGISSTGQGLVAIEWREGGEEFAVWRSDNGFEWTVEDVPIQDFDPDQAFAPIAAGGSEAMLVVVGGAHIDVYSRIQEMLSSQVGDDVDVTAFGWAVEVEGDEVRFPLHGPLGFPLAVLTPEDIGLTPAEVEAVIDNYEGRNQRTIVWTRTEEAGWLQSEIPDGFSIEAIDASPDGELIAFGWGSRGSTTWTSRDGVNWEESEASQGPYRTDEWQGRLVGSSDTGRASIVVAGEDGAWEDIGPADLFPNELDWLIGATGAGPGGIAAWITGWDRFGFDPIELGDPPQLTADGTILTLDVERGSYSLETEDGTKYSWSTHQTAPEGVSMDLETATIIFHDPETGDQLASFSIEEVTEAERSYWSDRVWSPTHQAFALTRDGVEWTIQDGADIGDDIGLVHLEVEEAHVIAVGIENARTFDPTASPGFRVWSAPIP